MTCRLLVLFAWLTVSGLAASCASNDLAEPRELAGSQRAPLPQVNTATLPDVTNGGEPFEFVATEDGLLVVYFGYTNCPDVCPTTLADIRSALRQIDESDAARVKLAFATIDPNRDTAEIITGYSQFFVDNASALRTTDPDELRAAADLFGVVYSVEELGLDEDGNPAFDVVHSGFAYVVDDQGQLLVSWPFGIAAEDMASDLEILFDQTRNAKEAS